MRAAAATERLRADKAEVREADMLGMAGQGKVSEPPTTLTGAQPASSGVQSPVRADMEFFDAVDDDVDDVATGGADERLRWRTPTDQGTGLGDVTRGAGNSDVLHGAGNSDVLRGARGSEESTPTVAAVVDPALQAVHTEFVAKKRRELTSTMQVRRTRHALRIETDRGRADKHHAGEVYQARIEDRD